MDAPLLSGCPDLPIDQVVAKDYLDSTASLSNWGPAMTKSGGKELAKAQRLIDQLSYQQTALFLRVAGEITVSPELCAEVLALWACVTALPELSPLEIEILNDANILLARRQLLLSLTRIRAVLNPRL
jgi:hypothetical protein